MGRLVTVLSSDSLPESCYWGRAIGNLLRRFESALYISQGETVANPEISRDYSKVQIDTALKNPLQRLKQRIWPRQGSAQSHKACFRGR